LALGETEDRLELIDGVVWMSPSPTPLHQLISQEINVQIAIAGRGAGSPWLVFLDTDVRFASKLVYRPDVSVYRRDRFLGVPARLMEPPDLVVEVLSDRSRPIDLATKRTDYERFGVGEYWIVDPETAELRCWQRTGGVFAAAPVGGDFMAS